MNGKDNCQCGITLVSVTSHVIVIGGSPARHWGGAVSQILGVPGGPGGTSGESVGLRFPVTLAARGATVSPVGATHLPFTPRKPPRTRARSGLGTVVLGRCGPARMRMQRLIPFILRESDKGVSGT